MAEKNQERSSALADETRSRIFSKPVEYYLEHFLIHGLLEKMNIKEKIDIVSNQIHFKFCIYDMIVQFASSRIIHPCSLENTVALVFPRLYNSNSISFD